MSSLDPRQQRKNKLGWKWIINISWKYQGERLGVKRKHNGWGHMVKERTEPQKNDSCVELFVC